MKTVSDEPVARPQERAAAFTTISGRPIERLYTQSDVGQLDYAHDIADPGAFPYVRGIHSTGYRGKLWTMRQFAGFGTPEETNERYRTLLRAGGTGSERRVRPADADGARSGSRALARRSRQVRRQRHVAGRHGNALRRHRPRRHYDLDDDQFAGGDDLRDVPGRRGKAGSGLADDLRDDSERHPQGVHRPEGVHLPAAAVDADHHGHLPLLCDRGAQVEYDLGQRLSHPRGGIDGAAGVGVHAQGRPGIRPVGRGLGSGRRRVRPADLILLQRAQRFLRGDREVPRRAEALGHGDARSVRGEERAVLEAALPHANGGRVADGAAALQQRRPDRAAGAVGRPRRHELTTYQLARRGARAADGRGGDARVAHAADHRQ